KDGADARARTALDDAPLLLQEDDDPLAGDLIRALMEDGALTERDRLLRLIENRALPLRDAVAALDADVSFGDHLFDLVRAATERAGARRGRRRRDAGSHTGRGRCRTRRSARPGRALHRRPVVRARPP